MLWSHISPGSYLDCGRDFPLAQNPFVRIVSLGSKDSQRAWSTIKKQFMILCYMLTKTFDVLPFSIQTHYSSKLGIPKETSLESKVQCCARLFHNSPATWTSRVPALQATNVSFWKGRKPSSHFPSDEARSHIHIHTHTHTHTHTHACAHMHTHTHTHRQHTLTVAPHIRRSSVFLTWPLSTTSLLMSEHSGSYTLGCIPHQTVHPCGHTRLCSSLSL